MSNLIVCLAAARARPESIMFGSIKEPCQECGCMVWVAPSSVKIREQELDVAIICFSCALRKDLGELMPLTQAQRGELSAHFAKN